MAGITPEPTVIGLGGGSQERGGGETAGEAGEEQLAAR